MLNECEQKKYDTISRLVSKEITIKEVITELNLTERQIYRLKKIFIEQGEEGTKCTLIIDYDGEYIGEIENKYYKMLMLENRDSVMKKESETKAKEKEHHKVVPPKNHPWRKNMMLRH